MSTGLTVREFVFFQRRDLSWLTQLLQAWGIVIIAFCFAGVVRAQNPAEPTPTESPYVVEGDSDAIAYAVGQSLRINGTAKNGAMAFGGDVIVQGTVQGDVAAVGGSVIQLEGARIDGDVIVVGGSYRHADKTPLRSPTAQTIMVAGYEQELRDIVRNPRDLLSPHWSARSIGLRVLAILFWFIVSLALTAAMPGTISRGITRLQMTSLRVALIGFIGVVAIGPGTWLALLYLPLPVGVVIGLMALVLMLIAGLFGRVIIYAATGRYLQRKFVNNGKNSETVALLVGTTFWIVLSSLPYVWPFVVAVIWVLSLGLALTARYRVGWKNRMAA
ncbi:MAG TPA: polymer-forming cytoskeletal protein [Pyrinomonadaceae bacterium]|nr:polymer-forming cytoskeletal protein [Pyrinomonadaceae bacterium]